MVILWLYGEKEMGRGGNIGYRAAVKKATRSHDAKKIDMLQTHLDCAGLHTLREQVIFNKEFKNGVRVSDLYFKDKKIILEHNTVKVHGELGMENAKTRAKYADYLRGEQHFFIINEDLCKELNLDQGDLSIYLYYHELAKQKAEYEV